MPFSPQTARRVTRIFWMMAALAVLVWGLVPGYAKGWDLRVYEDAVHSLRLGHDPYVDGMARQEVYHRAAVHAPGEPTPFTYVYSPLTLLLLRVLAPLPQAAVVALYCVCYGVAIAAALWIGLRMMEAGEAAVVGLIAPAAVFFPGLLENDVLFSGNIAYLLHAGMLAGAYVGWQRGRWRWFYAAVLAASCFKAPLLFALAIPVLSARRQWRAAALTGLAGAGLFAVQPLLWPATFRHYLQAVELQFSYNRDFSSSPAGLLANALYDVAPYQVTSGVFYVLYAALVFALLLRLSRRFLAGEITLTRWVPVLLCGVMLLNPRIMEYDVAPFTLMLALVLWRFVSRGQKVLRAAHVGLAIFLLLNVAATKNWRLTECCVLVWVFAMGVWDLRSERRGRVGTPEQALVVEAAG